MGIEKNHGHLIDLYANEILQVKKKKILWIAWETQRRSTQLGKELGADLQQLNCELPRFFRYFILILKTIKILLRSRYQLIFAQNPSIVLCFFIVAIRSFLNSKIIIDAHTPYLKLRGIKKYIVGMMSQTIFQGADLVIVTNDELKKKLENRHCRTKFYVLPDKIPDLRIQNSIRLNSKINIVLVCSYAPDEPYLEAIKAVSKCRDISLYITGNKHKISKEALSNMPKNVILTGFLPDKEYLTLIYSADIIMDLTDCQDNMVCGAYEGLAVGKPMILSKTKVLVEYFSDGVIHTENTAKDIYESIQYAVSELPSLRAKIQLLKIKRKESWEIQWKGLLKQIGINPNVAKVERLRSPDVKGKVVVAYRAAAIPRQRGA